MWNEKQCSSSIIFACFKWLLKPTCGLDEPGVRIVGDYRNWQIPEVQLQCARDDIDVFIGVHWDVCLLAICRDMWQDKGDNSGKMRVLVLKMAHISTFTSQCELRSKDSALWCWGKKNQFPISLLFFSRCISYHAFGLFNSDFGSFMHAFQRRAWPTCAGRLNITALWAGMTLCHGWSPACGSGSGFSPLLWGFSYG